MSDNLKELIENSFGFIFLSFCLVFVYFLVTSEPNYDKLIKSCEKIGRFNINENTTIKCELLK